MKRLATRTLQSIRREERKSCLRTKTFFWLSGAKELDNISPGGALVHRKTVRPVLYARRRQTTSTWLRAETALTGLCPSGRLRVCHRPFGTSFPWAHKTLANFFLKVSLSFRDNAESVSPSLWDAFCLGSQNSRQFFSRFSFLFFFCDSPCRFTYRQT